MKIVLRADVDNLGHKGDLVEVAPGYARNYLVPKGLAITASAINPLTFEDCMYLIGHGLTTSRKL